ncbi:XRE family transcriptional regulator [Streptomyces sp. NPDC127068]|uniref:XRE family transcriptional regulator n=1 Tax=Streptomyces sp. NPDC127068 TaxID=3347127 RepID=UPI00365AB89C
MKRRQFATATGTIAATTALPDPASASTTRIGMADTQRLEAAFQQIATADQTRGGSTALESRALGFARLALGLQKNGIASQRVRQRLYYLAAVFTDTALWFAIDARALERAERHLDRALRLAGLSGSPDIQLCLWGHAAMLAVQTDNLRDALAASEAGQASTACRQDPAYRSLAAARLAGAQARIGDGTAARRQVDVAARAYERAEPDVPREAWAGFFDRAELEGLSGLALANLGEHEQAEAYFHRTLAHLRPEYARNRQYYTTQLALSQLRQGDVELACVTGSAALAGAGHAPPNGRQRKLLDTFHRELNATTKRTGAAAAWTERYVDERNRDGRSSGKR